MYSWSKQFPPCVQLNTYWIARAADKATSTFAWILVPQGKLYVARNHMLVANF